MSKASWFDRIPPWIWFSFIPSFGGLAIVYAGNKAKMNAWMIAGGVLTGLTFVLFATNFWVPFWLIQIGAAFYLKRPFLVKTYPKDSPLPDDPKLALLLAEQRGKIDINTCSKNDLVKILNLPIVYANDIDSLRSEGHMFTSVQELSEVVGIPEATARRIEPLVTFSYDVGKEALLSWKCLNVYTVQEMISFGVEPQVAEKIVREREQRGEYKSPIEVKKRTGLSFNSYKQLL